MTVKELYIKAFKKDKFPSEIKPNLSQPAAKFLDYHYLRGSFHFTFPGVKTERLGFFDDLALNEQV